MYMTKRDCFFFVNLDVPEEDRTMSVLCVPCRTEKMPDTGWFYRGSVEGYGPFTYKCCLCGSVIHEPDQSTQGTHDEKETEATS